jgi:hypothetical protein
MTAINDALNLVIPVRSNDSGVEIYAYHTPISREVFEANYRPLAAAKSALSAKGVYYMMDAGPRIAALTLRDEGKKDAQDQGDAGDGGVSALLGEIRRLTMILAPSGGSWNMLPVDSAIAQGLIDADEWNEAESAIVFFTFHSALSRKADRARVATATASVLKGWSTSSSAMEYIGSLPTLTSTAATAAKVVSSVPS